MIRPPGGIVGAPPQWTPTATSGVFTLREAQEMLLDDTWARGPNAPTGLQGVSDNANIALTWSAPPGVVQNYLVYYSANGASDTVVPTNSASTSYTLAGLVNNVEYSVRVAAVSFTDGLLSAPFVIRVGVAAPVYFANGFLSTLHSDTVTVGEFPNAALANGYLSTLRLDTVPDSEFPNAALANGYLSTLRLDTIPDSEFPNAALANGYLSVLRSDPMPSGTVPTAPTGTSTAQGNLTGATVYNPSSDVCGNGWVGWNPPASDGGSAITGYKIAGDLGSVTVGPQFRYVNLGPNWGSGALHLANYGTTVTVRAINAVGEGPAATITNYFAWWDCG